MEWRGLEPGSVLGDRYEIQQAVGRGGMGAVYRALDRRLDTVVAVKEMLDKADTSEEREAATRQFQREAQLLAQLTHRNLPRVTDYFVDSDRCYLVMEFVHGKTLDAILRAAPPCPSSAATRRSPVPLMDALNWGIQLAEVLEFLHSQDPPIVFRDIKPANIMAQDDGVVKLIDFGIARRFRSGQTKDTQLYGSPGYSPPEQYGRSQTDPRSDLYSLGATLHHLVTGRDPSATPFKFPPIRSLDPHLPLQLEVFLIRCLEMEEAKRCQSADEALETLRSVRAEAERAALSSQPLTAVSGHVGSPAAHPVHKVTSRQLERARTIRLLRQVGAGVVVVLLLAGLSALALHRGHPKRTPAKTGSAGVPPTPLTMPSGGAGSASGGSAESPPPPAQDKPNMVTIHTEPDGLKVYFDGAAVGAAPVDVPNVAPGAHMVRVDPASSDMVTTEQVVTMTSGQHLTVIAQPAAADTGTAAPTSTPAATIQQSDVQQVSSGEPPQQALRVVASVRYYGASGKSASIAAFFYSPDGTTPLKPASEPGTYANRDGQLTISGPVTVDADPLAVVSYPLDIPASVLPVAPEQASYRVVIYVDGKAVASSDLMPLQPRAQAPPGSS